MPVSTDQLSFTVQIKGRQSERHGGGTPSFEIFFSNARLREDAFAGDLYSTAMAYIRGEIDVIGDAAAAIRFFAGRARQGWRHTIHALLGSAAWSVQSLWQTRRRAAENVRRHYDRSNEFYREFLDRSMTYSCAYFKTPESTINDAQAAKLDHILRKLDLQPGERFLDVGCGWGSLVEAAARRGASASGCTLSPSQFKLARDRTAGLNAGILLTDYRDLDGRWDKIASIGMFEHVGRRRLPAYFRKLHSILADNGLFLNHGIVRPQMFREGAESLFIRRMVFPGTELPHLGDLIRTSEEGGFEVLDVENLRPHYALTCRAWVDRLLHNADECVRQAGRETHRTWVLYLSGCAWQFEAGHLDVYQMLLAKRSNSLPRRMSRDYMYAGTSGEWNGD